jgi:16S rRNA (guanine966-N2)-methyltransferase
MRVVGGIKKGRRLASFKGRSIRPTSDKVREAVFNILPRDFPFSKILDLFAGTGAMGIEALSRGADYAVFVDNDQASIGTIRKNIETCGLEAAARVLKKDAPEAVRFLSKKGEKFDLIFIDPPYGSALVERALRAVDEEGILNADGILVAETSKRAPVDLELSGLERVDERTYGDTLIYFFAVKGKEDA